MRNVSNKSCTGNQNTNVRFKTTFFLENRVLYEIMWKNIVQPDKPQITMWRMRCACWIPKAKNKHTIRIWNMYCFSTGLVFNGLNVINGHYTFEMRPWNCPETSGTNYPATRRHPRRMEFTRYCKSLYQGVYREFYGLGACGALSSGKNTASRPKLRYCLLWCSVLTASAAVVYKGYKTGCLLCKLCSQLVLSCWEC